jgi:hypothetical protein
MRYIEIQFAIILKKYCLHNRIESSQVCCVKETQFHEKSARKKGIKRKRKIYPESATDWEIQIW